jgi:hypothetical protein
MLKKLTRGYTILAVLLLNVALCFIVLNLVLGLIYPVLDASRQSSADASQPGSLQYERSLLDRAYPDWQPAERDAMLHETWTRPLQCSPFTHFREAPYQGQYVNVHAAGFRQHNATPQPMPLDDSTVNIFVFGGSTTFGYGVADWETIPAYLQEQLAAQYPGQTIQVYNFGQAYYGSVLEHQLLVWLLYQGVIPDIAIFIDGLNEGAIQIEALPTLTCSQLDVFAQPEAPQITLPVARLVDSIRYRIFGQKKDETPAANTDDPTALAALEDTAEHNAANWLTTRRLIVSASEQFGFQTLFIWQPTPDYKYDLTYHLFLSADRATPAHELLYERIKAVYEQEQWQDFVWLADIQAGRHESLYVDQVHYSARFNAEIAGLIADALAEKQMFAAP